MPAETDDPEGRVTYLCHAAQTAGLPTSSGILKKDALRFYPAKYRARFRAIYHCFCSIILRVDLEVALGVVAGGADVGGLGADDDVAAVAAFPDLDLALFKDLGGLDIAQQRAVALFVMALDLADEAELLRELGKALFL